jgi:hypothetical protein
VVAARSIGRPRIFLITLKTKLFLGQTPLRVPSPSVRGRQVTIAGEAFYQIENYDRMRPFFMTVVSDADHWMFISSNGGLTAGRRDANLALFPYYTDDKIRDMAEVTGSKTLMQVRQRGKVFLWEPFSERGPGLYRVRRNLYKNFTGNQLVFEESNEDLGLTFRYGWFNSQRFGFIRRAWLTNPAQSSVRIRLLDGVQSLLPCGTGSQFNLEYSTLLDAYKRSELLPGTGLGLFRLSAIPVDRPEPAESLRTNVAWSIGLKRQLTLLSSVQLDRFRQGELLEAETDVCAERGAYFVQSEFTLRAGARFDWLLGADVNQGPCEVTQLDQWLRRPAQLRKSVLADVQRGTQELRRIVASADGLQQTSNALGCARHYSNTLFNIMRGGVFPNGYQVEVRDVQAFVQNANREIAARHAIFFRKFGSHTEYRQLVAAAMATGDSQLERICREYLPLTFSRRHGDPSRPWNRFSIATRNADGTRRLHYEGNWRDIFQNWEALAVSFPDYTTGMICRFLNASTADGYNPYRITCDGIEWEVADPHDPWSHIGYWGDHQIIYLLRLLEHLNRHEPDTLRALLAREIFAYANVPYCIKPYEQVLANPKVTVDFDSAQAQVIHHRVQSRGADGKLLWNEDNQIGLVNLTEKLLVPLLTKLSNFIPGAGIWLNTQRPEWNDANNALVGNGTSMVTLYYLRRYLTFCRDLLNLTSEKSFLVSAEVGKLFRAIHLPLENHRGWLTRNISDQQRKQLVDELGQAGSTYRQQLYAQGLSPRKGKLATQQMREFLTVALDWVTHSIQSNRRADGLYHAYNLVRFDSKAGLPIRRLYEMLEGQVAVLSSGQLSATESLNLLRALKRSAMYRADQHSYLLYPNRQLPRFTAKNNIPPPEFRRSKLLAQLLATDHQQLIQRDVTGKIHFHPSITNARDVQRILGDLSTTRHAQLASRETPLILEIFEHLFDHESFTGRSGTFYGYEGLGCIYWHMVSKLLLAAQEVYFAAVEANATAKILQGLAECYYDLRAGIGDAKSPEEYGAFPMDPYSHTPGHAGARQPGLTGQVKEDFLCRFGELGVVVANGQVHFQPRLLRRAEFCVQASVFEYFDVAGTKQRLRLKAGELAFTYCQIPVIYRLAGANSVKVVRSESPVAESAELKLSPPISRECFERTGRIQRIEVNLSGQF